jgi:hypothetical protein
MENGWKSGGGRRRLPPGVGFGEGRHPNIYQYLDMVVLVLDERVESLVHNLIHPDPPRNHGLRRQFSWSS